MTGEPLEPVLACTAAAPARGQITPEHVEVIRKSITKLPGFVDAGTREQFEADLVRTAVGVGPKEVGDVAELTLFLLDQDGPAPDDTERNRTRGITIGPQKRRGGNSTLSGELTPEARAVLEVIFAKYAAPGMCNPADPEPCTSGTPTQAQIDNDHRSLAQRQHDALIAVGRIALMSGQLGQLNGLPVSIIIRTTLQDLESRAGVGVTGGGTIMPIAEVIRMAAHANHYLAVFDKATGSALDLFRARRVASPAQRIMLIGREGGLHQTVLHGRRLRQPGPSRRQGLGRRRQHQRRRTRPGLRTRQPHGRQDGGWTTSINARGEVEWAPPPQLDTGQARVNNYHRPERLLHPPDEPEPESDDTGEPEPIDPWGTMTPISPTNPTQVNLHRPNRSGMAAAANRNRSTPLGNDDADQPGGPAPPDDQAA